MDKIFGIQFEKAMRLLCDNIPLAETLGKPTLFHCLRTGVYLYNHHYPENIILAGLLHDVIEDTTLTEQELSKAFGNDVTNLVKANTKDKNIQNQDDRINELIKRCAENGEEALIVKAADILDNFTYFHQINDAKGIDYCARNTKALLNILPAHFKDPIFNKLVKN